MLNPKYKGGDGELLWHIYYGDYADDERFDSFRADQMWDADVIRPFIEEDTRFEELNAQQLAALNVNGESGSKTSSSTGWWMLYWSIGLVLGSLVYWYRDSKSSSKLFNSVEATSLLTRGRQQDDGSYVEIEEKEDAR